MVERDPGGKIRAHQIHDLAEAPALGALVIVWIAYRATTIRSMLREQPPPVFVLGHSVGGLVTATSTLRDQNGLQGMILIAPALNRQVSGLLLAVARTAGFLIPTFSVPIPPADPGAQSRDPHLHERLAQDPTRRPASRRCRSSWPGSDRRSSYASLSASVG
jgi:alpha-beta hydrolase superfamily lysophospholipase